MASVPSNLIRQSRKQSAENNISARMEGTLCYCCCRTMFPESFNLKMATLQFTECWKSARLRPQTVLGFSSRKVCTWWFLFVLMLGTVPSTALASCSGLGRTILTDLQGTITDGDGKYPEDEHCEWLILAPNVNMTIQLTFKHFSTECTYDYLSIFDGDSFTSPKIATFSGDRTPDPVVAHSGKMLIFLYSDTNYNLNGTEATYVIQNCTNNCSGHGTCDVLNHTCTCELGYQGEACNQLTCPSECGTDLSHGTCIFIGNSKSKCKCATGYAGESCSVSMVTDNGWGSTLIVSSGVQTTPETFTLLPRTGHGAVYHAVTYRLWVYGGFGLRNVLADLVNYDFVENEWSQVVLSSGIKPTGRYGHTMVLYENEIIIFGGVQANDTLSNELWSFDIFRQQWTLLPPGSDSVPPGLADHSASIVNFSHLFVFGGRSETDDFASVIYKYDLSLKSGWEIVSPLGGLEKSIAVRGHSSVFHSDSQTLVIFGGFTPSSARVSERTNEIVAFHVEKRYWTKWVSNSAPRQRAFHTANIIGNYMVVYGGNVHIHQTSVNINKPLEHEKCYEQDIELYHLGCHQWVDFNVFAKDFQDPEVTPNVHTVTRGRFGHAASVRDDSTLLIMGGYNGVVLKDTLAIKLQGDINKCNYHKSETNCLKNPDCGWCSNPKRCLPHDQENICTGTFTLATCPGTCHILSTCESCAIWGQGSNGVTYAPSWSHSNKRCGWCVQEQRCYPVNAPEGYCADRSSYTGPIGWWGRNGTFISNLNMCVTRNTPPGMTWVKFRHPKNESYPDELSIVENTGQTFAFDGVTSEHRVVGVYTAEYKGFIKPLDATPKTGQDRLQVWMGSSKATSTLSISSDSNPDNLELVASYSNVEFKLMEAVRPDGYTIFPNPSGRYYVHQVETQTIKVREVRATLSTMELKWNGNLEPSQVNHPFSAEYLEPFSTPSCSHYITCMGCLMDASCGWCPISSTCEKRHGPMLSIDRCGSSAGVTEHYLVTDVVNCGSCDIHVDCLSCAEDQYCEWLLDDTTCVRRGRFPDAVTDPAQCHGMCSQYKTCIECSKKVQECAWCEGLQTCFMFGTYITTYTYGQCTHWFDMKKPCPACSSHTNCNDCLAEFQCGWCGNTDNPTIGFCHSGDFSGPASNRTCGALVAAQYNISSTEPANWSYESCPDVQECRLGLDDCHSNATCINTPESYECECKRGFVGNGKSVCNKTCYHECKHGHCSGPPNYECICDIGWTGINCSTECGCNYHSTCVNGIGMCDECQHWTMGEHCELCRPGSYGNATNSPGCLECECNGHGDVAMGTCDNNTGICYCTENTLGAYCDKCLDGFYGDPRNNEHCYHQCEGRMILTDVTSSALGSHNGAGVSDPERAYCLWILTVYNNLTDPVPIDPVPSISVTLNNIHTACGRDYVYVYDGIPHDMVVDAPSFIPDGKMLAAFCGHELLVTPVVVAESGILTVVFQANISDLSITSGFTSIFRVNSCPSSCYGNRYCDKSNRCVCKDGYRGADCEVKICPEDCGKMQNQGECDEELGLCSCSMNYLGPSCQYYYVDPLMQAIWTTLYDPSLHATLTFAPSDLITAPVARMGHSMVIAEMDSKLFLFGGYSQERGPLNDVWSYNVVSRQWQQLVPITNLVPKARHFHATAFVKPKSLFLVGGLTDDGVADDFWEFNVVASNWTQITGYKNFPHLAGHTLTMIDDKHLLLIGGYSPEDGLLHAVVQYTISTGLWEGIQTTGTPPTGIYGHSTVWHMESGALYIFGGYRFHLDSISISDKLYSLNYVTKEWSMLPPAPYNKPEPHMFHAAIATSQYMLVIAGGTPSYNFSNSLLAYRFDCNKWLDLAAEELVLGSIPRPAVSQTAVISGNTVYLYGGTNGHVQGDLSMLNLPEDLCSTKTTTEDCRALPGCAACVVTNETNNLVFCRSNVGGSLINYCSGANTLKNGILCNNARVETRDCRQLVLCSECVMTHPAHPNARQTCKWCSNCPEGKCIPQNADCLEEHDCQMETQREITSSGQCAELACEASDCKKCTASTDCMWTKQFMRTSETRRMLNSKPVYDWNCFNKALLRVAPANYDIQRVPPDLCPQLCHMHKTCSDCLESNGADGGWQECVWSANLRQCMSPTYMPLLCASGDCGPLYNGSNKECPMPCYLNIQCAHCLHQPGCGWCGINNDNGTGVCMEGGLHGPIDGMCTAQNVSLTYQSMPAAISTRLESLLTATKPGSEPDWTYIACPPENECFNGHHDCMENEECHNTPVLYECRCKPGYERQEGTGKCKPVCSPMCMNGECIQPNVCKCQFGYVGADCSVACQCNGHSECANVSTTDVCLECKDNTKGMNCERCLPLFVGNATNGGTCKSCSLLCYGNTEICLSEADFNRSKAANYDLVPSNVELYFPVGPVDEASTVCVNCGNYSAARTCNTCIDGYFKDGLVCKQCQCNGHWDTCNKDTGLNCQCQNNTVTPTCPSNSDTGKYSEPCWRHQCSTCKELYLGEPTEGRQCYRQMQVEQDNCFEPQTQNTCPLDAQLPLGRSSFFYVQPKYTNLDIRLTVDVTVGALDVFLTYDQSVFRVFVNKTSGIHTIEYDPDLEFEAVVYRAKRDMFEGVDWVTGRRRRSSQENLVNPDAQEINTGTTEEPVMLKRFETLAKGINTFVTIENGHFISIVRNLRNRLVVSLPHQYHQLKTKRFYIALLSLGTEWHNATQGIMYFRQDQPQIDLFVFFSVFLSCFFLFLAVLVVAWKIKVGFEARNDRRMRALEMVHRASRPFGKVMVYMDDAQTVHSQNHKRQSRLTRLTRSSSSLGSSGEQTQASSRPGSAHKDPFHIGIIATEPTDDGIAAIGTLVISLPGGIDAPVRACLGSALVTLKNTHRQQQEPQYVRQPKYQGIKPVSASCRRSNNRRV